MTHKLVHGLGHIGGDDSPWEGARRSVPACANPGCLTFRRDDGSLACLNDPNRPASLECEFAPAIPVPPQKRKPLNPNDWGPDDWKEAISHLRRPSSQELDMMALRMKIISQSSADPTKPAKGGAPLSFSQMSTKASSMAGVQAITDMLEGLIALASGEEAEATERFNAPVFRLCDREGALLVQDRLADFARTREKDLVQLHLPDGATEKWAWSYFKAINQRFDQHLQSLPPSVPIPNFIEVLGTPFVWVTDPKVEVCNMWALRIKTFLLHALATINPALYAAPESDFWSSLQTQILEVYYRKVILGKGNIVHHLKSKGSKGDESPSDPSKPKSQKKRPGKRQRDQKKDQKQPPEKKARDEEKLYTECQKCNSPTPRGIKSKFPNCIKCRKA